MKGFKNRLVLIILMIVCIPKVFQNLVFGIEKAPGFDDHKRVSMRQYNPSCDRSNRGAFSKPKIQILKHFRYNFFSLALATISPLTITPEYKSLGHFFYFAEMAQLPNHKDLVVIFADNGDNGRFDTRHNKIVDFEGKIHDEFMGNLDTNKMGELQGKYPLYQDSKMVFIKNSPDKYEIHISNFENQESKTIEIAKYHIHDSLNISGEFIVQVAEVNRDGRYKAFIFDLQGRKLAEIILSHFEFDFDDMYNSFIAIHPEELKILILSELSNLYLYDLTPYTQYFKELAG